MNDELEFLRDELADVRGNLQGLLKSGEQLLALVSTLIAGAYALTDDAERRLVVAMAPLALLGVATYVLRVNALVQHVGGYRRALEERVNTLLGADVTVWEAKIAPLVKLSFASVLNTTFFGAVWAFVVVAAYVAVIGSTWNPLACVLYLVFLFVATLGLVASLVNGMRLFSRSYEAALAALS